MSFAVCRLEIALFVLHVCHGTRVPSYADVAILFPSRAVGSVDLAPYGRPSLVQHPDVALLFQSLLRGSPQALVKAFCLTE